MKAAYYENHGTPEVLKIGDLPVPEPQADEVLVQVAAAGINPIDRRLRNGELSEYIARTFPVVPGWDLSGRITSVGSEVTNYAVGDAVAGLAFTWSIQHGTNAEFAPVKASAIARKPDGLSYEQAAALPLVSLTAWQSLAEFANIQPGQSVLIQAGAGGLGSVAICIAKHLGATVYTTCSAKNFDYVLSRGADHAIDYTKSDYVQVLGQMEPEGVDMVLESLLSEAATRAAIHITKPGGTVVYMNNEPPEMEEIQKKNIKTEFLHHRPDGESLAKLMSLYQRGILKLPQLHVMPLDKVKEAHELSESGHIQGKLVLHIQDM